MSSKWSLPGACSEGGLARSSRLKEMSMNHDMRPLSLLLNDSFELLNAELRDNQLTMKQTNKLYKLGNLNTRANNFVCSLTFILHKFLEGPYVSTAGIPNLF
jgi:hypothetical protein